MLIAALGFGLGVLATVWAGERDKRRSAYRTSLAVSNAVRYGSWNGIAYLCNDDGEPTQPIGDRTLTVAPFFRVHDTDAQDHT